MIFQIIFLPIISQSDTYYTSVSEIKIISGVERVLLKRTNVRR